MASSLGFGFARSLAWAIAARSVAGASAGTIGIIRTTVAEMVPERALQPRAFSVMPLVWSVSCARPPTLRKTVSGWEKVGVSDRTSSAQR